MSLFNSKNEYSHITKGNVELVKFKGGGIHVEIRREKNHVYVDSKNKILNKHKNGEIKTNNYVLLDITKKCFIINGVDDVRLLLIPNIEIKNKPSHEVIETPYYFNETIIRFLFQVDKNENTNIFIVTSIKMLNCFFLQEDDSEFDKIKTFIMKNIKNISIDEVANTFNMSIRKLQYKFKNNHTTYRKVVDDIKIKKILYLLSLGGSSPKKIINNSGYNSISSANRAFTRYTGQTIYQYMQNVSND